MSEKQFKLSSETVLQYQIMDNDTDLNENEVCDLLNEQQATIRRLQDLCGESDGENAKLRIENKKLKDDLHNCRLNKSIIREKLKMWQDVHKEYDIYSIKDFEESFELDAKINKEKGI